VGESFAVLDEDSGEELGASSVTHCDQVTVSPTGTCWTIEIHRSSNGSSLWPLVEQQSLDAILTGGRYIR